ncbi:MAG: exonuclease subunit SbcD [Spirochaetaceae bacterium]|nr:exonuclease subunit SbcD [Spirochaetaceae bacterium]
MKFIHTADLHLGKVFHEYPLLEDQRHILKQLAALLADPSYRALVIAGDVYDRSIPAPEAVSLFSGFLGQLKFQRPDIAVLVLPGNHDSAARLGFGKELFEGLGIHLVTDAAGASKPVMIRDAETGDVCAFFLLPFLRAGDLDADGAPLRSQERLAACAAARLEEARRAAREAGARWTVLAAHLFAGGGASSESERVFLGNAEQVDIGLFAEFDYAALGHLHRFQRAGQNGWYAGSPLAYSFGEAKHEKVFLSVELGPGAPVITPLPARPLRPLLSLAGSFRYFYREDAAGPDAAVLRAAENAYLEINLTGADLTANPLPLLRRRFPWLLSVRQDEAFARLRAENGLAALPSPSAASSAAPRTLTDDFRDFLADIYGGDLFDDEKTALFGELVREAEHGEEA